MSLFKKNVPLKEEVAPVMQEYTGQHPMLSFKSVSAIVESDHLDQYMEVHPFESSEPLKGAALLYVEQHKKEAREMYEEDKKEARIMYQKTWLAYKTAPNSDNVKKEHLYQIYKTAQKILLTYYSREKIKSFEVILKTTLERRAKREERRKLAKQAADLKKQAADLKEQEKWIARNPHRFRSNASLEK